eukprot:gene18017-24427_t
MQVIAKSTQRIAATKPAARAVAPRGSVRVECKASKVDAAKLLTFSHFISPVVCKASKVDAAKACAASLPMLLVSNPAFALVS